MTTSYLLFISKKIIARKQILQVPNMSYDARPIFILYPQPNGSILVNSPIGFDLGLRKLRLR